MFWIARTTTTVRYKLRERGVYDAMNHMCRRGNILKVYSTTGENTTKEERLCAFIAMRYKSPSHEALKALPTDVLVTLSPVFTYDLVLVGVIGGVSLGVVILWLLVVQHTRTQSKRRIRWDL
ncbi:uncharacterized protein EDB91DRAFT_1084589 [Suillus paluster]|uniref:uncharacterized protein n=1 Tax=Suillus paluster TaxID=48578 RepID=UPI001B863EE7|nr:uncharacterized protein EDB91DRAFT_1084589 [Suillus paluster]KAG1733081.1 hypothetical protein EDB91DRAFT_1084589 [Suillus paluster]